MRWALGDEPTVLPAPRPLEVRAALEEYMSEGSPR